MKSLKNSILKFLGEAVGEPFLLDISAKEEPNFGHYSTNTALRLAKARGKKPLDLAGELARAIEKKAPAGFFEKVEAVNPGFINFWLTKKTLQGELENVSKNKNFGAGEIGKGETAIVEYSQPNIAKKMHVGHLRTTIIGDALANILSLLGYRVVRWNYLGDWGTQFGKLIAAYKLWGDEAAVKKDPINELQGLYVRFHDEMKGSPELENRGREEFRKLEEGDRENRKLWEWFKKESLAEFKNTYETLGVKFDVWLGESFFEKDSKKIVKELFERGVAEKSEGAIVVKLDAFNLPPALIEKGDGGSLYLGRDLANIRYRLQKYKPAKILYVVGNEQSLHFDQLFALAKILKFDASELVHVKFGLVLGEAGKKLSTREGRTEPIETLLARAIGKTRAIVEEKNKELEPEEKDGIARAVALGALKYNDFKENRTTDIVFDWDKMLDFGGDSGPYLQYAHARLLSILRKAGKSGKADLSLLQTENELALMRKIFEFPEAIIKAAELYSTSVLANYLYKLAVAANKFYETTPVIKDENEPRRAARLLLAEIAARTLRKGLRLLGIDAPEKI